MTKYEINSNVVFIPDGPVKLTVDGQPVHIPKLQVKLLRYFLDNAGETKSKNTILDEVWGKEGTHTHTALSNALRDLHKLLPDDCRIMNLHNVGYVFTQPLTISQWRYDKVEKRLANSPKLNLVIVILTLLTLIYGANSLASLYHYLYPPRQHQLINLEPKFTRGKVIGTALPSPDKRFIAHRATSKIFEQDKLALHDRQSGDSRPLVKLHFLAGFEWDLTGNRLVYQNMLDGQCEVRLITFHNEDKTDFSDELLTSCYKTSGSLSFAWFNDKEFYVNFTGKAEINSPNGLPLHHLYSFNVENKRKTPLTKATYQGGVGFHSLEFDRSTNSLYFLQLTGTGGVDFLRYRDGQITKIKTLDYIVQFFTVDNDQLVYKNDKQQFVINAPAADFANQQLLLQPRLGTLNQPQLMDNKLVYFTGAPFAAQLYQWPPAQGNQAQHIDLQGFKPVVFARYHNQLVFIAKQTGKYQLYLLDQQQQIQQISHFTDNHYIQHIEVIGERFILSFLDKVNVYHYQKDKLQLCHSLPNYTLAIANPAGNTLLLTTTDKQGNKHLVEKPLNNLNANGTPVPPAKLSFYHNNDIIQLNNDNELIRLNNGTQQLIADNIKVSNMAKYSIQGERLYYLARNNHKTVIHSVNLKLGTKTTITTLEQLNPTTIQAIGDNFYLRAAKALKPTLMEGTLTLGKQ